LPFGKKGICSLEGGPIFALNEIPRVAGYILGVCLICAIKIGEIDAAITCTIAIDKIRPRFEAVQPLSDDRERKPSSEFYGAWRTFGYLSEPLSAKSVKVD